MKELAESGVNVNTVNRQYQTPLHIFVAHVTKAKDPTKHYEILKELLEAGARTRITTKVGNSPSKDRKTPLALAQNGANNSDPAIQARYVSVVTLLEEQQAIQEKENRIKFITKNPASPLENVSEGATVAIPENVIGKGGFGQVFRGTVRNNGETIEVVVRKTT
jgi:hypothetical protein